MLSLTPLLGSLFLLTIAHDGIISSPDSHFNPIFDKSKKGARNGKPIEEARHNLQYHYVEDAFFF